MNGRWWARAYVGRKNESTPMGLSTGIARTRFSNPTFSADTLKMARAPVQPCWSDIRTGQIRGGSRISGKGVRLYKGMGFALLILYHFS